VLTRIISLGLFFSLAGTVFSFGKSESALRRELAKEHITAIPISKEWVIDYVYTSEDTLLLSIGFKKLVLLDLSINEQKSIEVPENLAEVTHFKQFTYDSKANSVHMLVQEKIEAAPGFSLSYYILYLDDFSWGKITELGYKIEFYYYDLIEGLIYVKDGNNQIMIFDFVSRKYINTIQFSKKIGDICCMYGDPLKFLATIQVGGSYHYGIFNLDTGDIVEFPDAHITDMHIAEYTPWYGNNFLGIQYRRLKSIMVFDIYKDTKTWETLKTFKQDIYRLKRRGDGEYSFLIVADDKWTLLCRMAYP
jgi:hypothetical protein